MIIDSKSKNLRSAGQISGREYRPDTRLSQTLSNSHFKISQVWYPAHFHYAQKPSERRESAQGASI